MALDESKGYEMLNFGRNDRWVEVKDPSKPAVNPAANERQFRRFTNTAAPPVR